MQIQTPQIHACVQTDDTKARLERTERNGEDQGSVRRDFSFNPSFLSSLLNLLAGHARLRGWRGKEEEKKKKQQREEASTRQTPQLQPPHTRRDRQQSESEGALSLAWGVDSS